MTTAERANRKEEAMRASLHLMFACWLFIAIIGCGKNQEPRQEVEAEKKLSERRTMLQDEYGPRTLIARVASSANEAERLAERYSVGPVSVCITKTFSRSTPSIRAGDRVSSKPGWVFAESSGERSPSLTIMLVNDSEADITLPSLVFENNGRPIIPYHDQQLPVKLRPKDSAQFVLDGAISSDGPIRWVIKFRLPHPFSTDAVLFETTWKEHLTDRQNYGSLDLTSNSDMDGDWTIATQVGNWRDMDFIYNTIYNTRNDLDRVWTFSGGTLSVRYGSTQWSGIPYRLGPGNPPKIDIVDERSGAARVRGVYQLTGDRLKLCFASVQHPRPFDFTAEATLPESELSRRTPRPPMRVVFELQRKAASR